MKAISGLLSLKSGKISFQDQQINHLPPQELVSKGLAMVPEGREVFPYMTVRDNLSIGAYQVRDRNRIKKSLDLIFSLFPRLQERQKQEAGNLSGGEQQMLVIGRALMSQPSFLMLDEPSLGLQPSMIATVMKTVVDLNRDQNFTILLVEQNVRKSLEVASRGYILKDGRVSIQGKSEELLEDESVKQAYLGQ